MVRSKSSHILVPIQGPLLINNAVLLIETVTAVEMQGNIVEETIIRRCDGIICVVGCVLGELAVDLSDGEIPLQAIAIAWDAGRITIPS